VQVAAVCRFAVICLEIGVNKQRIYSLGREDRIAASDGVDLISFFKEELGEVRTILTGYTGEESFLH
jgi:hypothetical protein